MSTLELFEELHARAIATIAEIGYREGGPAKEAPASWPLGVVRRRDGDLVVADYHGNRLWRIDQDGILHTVAGDGVPGGSGDGDPATEARFRNPHDLALDMEGNLFVNDIGNQTYRRIDSKTGVVTRIAGSGNVGRGGDSGVT